LSFSFVIVFPVHRRRRSDSQIIMTAKISASFHGSPRNFQTSFYITKNMSKSIHKVLREGEIGFLDCSHSRRTPIFVHQIQYHFALSQHVRTRRRRLETILSLSLRKLRQFSPSAMHVFEMSSAFPLLSPWSLTTLDFTARRGNEFLQPQFAGHTSSQGLALGSIRSNPY